MIAVTCRNGEHFTIDPDHIERVETRNDTTLHMVDGSKYVIDQELDELLATVRDHRAATFVARTRLVDGPATEPADSRHARPAWDESPFAASPDGDAD